MTIKREVWYRWEYLKHRLKGPSAGAPPHLLKRRVLRSLAARHGVRVMIETGTYMGDMVAAQLRAFRRIDTIELSPELAARARGRFAGKSQVTIHQGDSASVLGRLMAQLSEPALIWLDAHWSGGITAGDPNRVPIMKELDVILSHPLPGHVVLIDDARCFDGTAGYPVVREIEDRVARSEHRYTVTVADDIIRVLPAADR